MKSLFGLEFKVFSVLTGLALVSITTLGFMIYALNEGRVNQQLVNRLAQVNTLSDSIFRRSDNYLQSAPRSFSDYNRDLIVFYTDFSDDLGNMDKLVTLTGNDYYSRSSSYIEKNLNIGLRTAKLDKTFNLMTTAWTKFYSELNEKLGPDKAEPRLEWGTEYIRNHQQQLRQIMNSSIVTLNDDINSQTQRMEEVSYLAMGVLVLMALSGLVWFYFGVTHRIKLAVAGCVRVSSGDFGHQINADSKDEIGILARAINTLSMRTRLVLSIVDNIRTANNHTAALEAIWDESQPLFNLVWLGLYKLDDDFEHMELLSAQPHSWAKILNKQDIRAQHTPMQVIQTQKALVINDIDDFSSSRPTERLMRSLNLKIINSESCLFLPIVHKGKTWGMLTMISENRHAFTEEDIKLLKKLTPLLSDAFVSVEVLAKDTSEDKLLSA